MLELRLKTSEMSTFENHFHIMYIFRLKKQVQRIINEKSTTYFFSFSNFKILHQLIKSFVIPTPHRVYNQSKCHYLKKQLKKLEKLKELEKLENRPTSNNKDYHTHQKTTVYLINTNRAFWL